MPPLIAKSYTGQLVSNRHPTVGAKINSQKRALRFIVVFHLLKIDILYLGRVDRLIGHIILICCLLPLGTTRRIARFFITITPRNETSAQRHKQYHGKYKYKKYNRQEKPSK